LSFRSEFRRITPIEDVIRRSSFDALASTVHESFHSFSFLQIRERVEHYGENNLGDERKFSGDFCGHDD
jgi:hypothetical protein